MWDRYSVAVSEKIGSSWLNGEHLVALWDPLRYESSLQDRKI